MGKVFIVSVSLPIVCIVLILPDSSYGIPYTTGVLVPSHLQYSAKLAQREYAQRPLRLRLQLKLFLASS
jgi:hypothetical protein